MTFTTCFEFSERNAEVARERMVIINIGPSEQMLTPNQRGPCGPLVTSAVEMDTTLSL